METTAASVSVACQTEPNLIDKLIDKHVRKQLEDVDLYQEYVRSAQCAQFWPLDKNPIRSLVPSMVKVDLPEQYLKNESLMFDLVQAITNNSKLVNLLAKYIHHIVPNVIISKRIDLIPLITCTIRVCRDQTEQERLVSLLFNLIKRPNEEQRRMILSGIIVVLQVSPQHQSSSLLLPNLWDHVNDKFPERRILLAESCATLAHYVRPVMRTNLILSILIQLLRDKNAAVRSAACKSFSCLLTLIMDRNDEVFDACLSATEDIIQDVLQQTPMNFCEHRYELEQMRFCALETVYPLLCMWAVKLNRFKLELAEFYLAKGEKYFATLLAGSNQQSSRLTPELSKSRANSSTILNTKAAAAAAIAKRRSIFFESKSKSSSMSSCSSNSGSGLFGGPRRQSAFVSSASVDSASNSAMLTSQRAASAYLKMLNYLVPFVFSDSVNSCAWLSKSNLHLQDDADKQQVPSQCEPASETSETDNQTRSARFEAELSKQDRYKSEDFVQLFDRPLNFNNKLLEPTLIIDESAIVAFHDQLKQEHMIESLDWLLNTFLPKFLEIVAQLSHERFYLAIGGGTSDTIQEFQHTTIMSMRQLCLLFGRHLTRTKIRPFIKNYIVSSNMPSLYSIYIASLTSFEPIEQQEFEEIVLSIRQNLQVVELTRDQVEILAISIKIIATNHEHIQSPSTRQKFLTYILDALANYSNQIIRTQASTMAASSSSSLANAANSLQSSSSYSSSLMLVLFRHILTCLIDPSVRPLDWAHILVTKFLPLLISLANDSTDVYVCTYARLMCAQLVETFDTYLNSPKLTKQSADSILPALSSLRGLTEQIKASNLKRQIESLTHDLNEKFFKDENNNNIVLDIK